MLLTKELENGKVEVSSSIGKVDIGNGAVKALIISKEEVEYVSEVNDVDEE